MRIEWLDIAKAMGFAYARFSPAFTLKKMDNSAIWNNQHIKFVLIAAPRTGSNLLVSMLNSHPEILCHYELFHWQKIYAAAGGQGDLSAMWARNRNPFSFLEKIYSDGFEKKAVGFKIFPNHNPLILSYLIHQPKIKKIILRRNNYLKIYTSHIMAKKNKVYVYRPNSQPVPVYVCATRFKRYVNKNEAFYQTARNKIRAVNQDFLEIEYQLIKATQSIKKLLDFIGVDDSCELKAGTKKQNPGKLSDRIINYSELCHELRDTEYEKFLT
ncbi:MAG: hypothetical protein PF482_10770 [Desulfobacteraceae bacterium]|jgi:LPS sulfotransferase NodH|nr:hypothetical protein [Desulfobacteraceae bacterium]